LSRSPIEAQVFTLPLDGGLIGAVLQQRTDLLRKHGEGLHVLTVEPRVKGARAALTPAMRKACRVRWADAGADGQLPQAFQTGQLLRGQQCRTRPLETTRLQ